MQDEPHFIFQGQVDDLRNNAEDLRDEFSILLKEFNNLSPQQRSELFKIGTMVLYFGRKIHDMAMEHLERQKQEYWVN